jgi:hypothetical protein
MTDDYQIVVTERRRDKMTAADTVAFLKCFDDPANEQLFFSAAVAFAKNFITKNGNDMMIGEIYDIPANKLTSLFEDGIKEIVEIERDNQQRGNE